MKKPEQAPLVDEYDVLIGYKNRADLTPRDRSRIVAIWLENNNGEVLIAQRSPTKRVHPGLWGPAAAGGIIKGESAQQCAYRELEEELGITSAPLTYCAKTEITDSPDLELVFCYWFIGRTDLSLKELRLEAHEVTQAKWLPKQKLLNDAQKNPRAYTPSMRDWLMASDENLVS